ncbi:Hypothetical predicted protein [Paramuricea clavata]|uniref:Uncharacterized protein n=1 Tax=Paramuricea clavata TaxID=317549 RepID=A0A7D9HH29_PARCT|nr:Hypothetical predicted protein [Paramuricea clavata]
MVEDNFLQQFILSPTHIAGNIFDLQLCNTPNIIGDVSLSHPESCGFPTDHYIVELEIHLKFKRATPVNRQVFDYKNGNLDSLRSYLTQFPIAPSDYPDLLESEGQISEILLDVDDVSQCLSYLDTPKATGPDGIPSQLLQACNLEIAPSICELFNHSLDTGHIWESANVTPVHKKERIEPAENYRPISLLPILGKVLERCVCLRFYDHIRHLIKVSQHGFLQVSKTTIMRHTVLICSTRHWTIPRQKYPNRHCLLRFRQSFRLCRPPNPTAEAKIKRCERPVV